MKHWTHERAQEYILAAKEMVASAEESYRQGEDNNADFLMKHAQVWATIAVAYASMEEG